MALTQDQAFAKIATLLAMSPEWSSDTAEGIADIVDEVEGYPHPGGIVHDEESAQFYLNLARDNSFDYDADVVCHELGCWVAVLDEDEGFCEEHRLMQEEWHGVTRISEGEVDVLEGLTEHFGWRDVERWFLAVRPDLNAGVNNDEITTWLRENR